MNAPVSSVVRTFRGPDSRAVLSAVKAALGPDAMIISTREIPASLFKPASIEVTAALVDEQEEEAVATPPPEPERPDPEATGSPEIRRLTKSARAEGGRTRPTEAGRNISGDPVNSALQVRRHLDRELDALRACVAETESALSAAARQARAGRDLQLAPAAAEFHTHLCLQGVDPLLAEELVRQLAQAGMPRTAAGFRDPARAAIGRILRSCPPPFVPHADRKRRVIALVGPTGVGKTTTIAKIAARALLDYRQRVALVTLDTYRIGAAEQIAHYGNLMDAPAFVARDRAELCAALARCEDTSLVLIDTAGRSQLTDVARQAEVARAIPGVELILVLSATTSAQDLTQLARRYRALMPNQVVFTKVDETSAPGGLLSVPAVTPWPVAGVANGQRVPEDLQSLGDAELVDLVLGESRWTLGRN